MELSAEWVVGFTDGEGCFHVSVVRNPKTSTGYQVIPEFVIVQHQRDAQILYALKRFFRCGVVRKNNADRSAFRVRKLECLQSICAFFTAHPLKTRKNVEFVKFRRIIHYMGDGLHLTLAGLLQIVEVAETMNTQRRHALDAIRQEIQQQIAARRTER